MGSESGNPPPASKERFLKEGKYEYTGSFSARRPYAEYVEKVLDDSAIVSAFIDDILRTSKAGEEFSEASLSIRNATRRTQR